MAVFSASFAAESNKSINQLRDSCRGSCQNFPGAGATDYPSFATAFLTPCRAPSITFVSTQNAKRT